MMKNSFIIIGILFSVALFSLPCFADAPVAVILKNKGEVNLYKTATSGAETVKKGQVLYDGNKIRTGTSSFCAIKFIDDKSLLRLKENSSCVIEGKREKDHINKNIIVEVGSFFASLFKQKGQFLVTTPTSVASVKGTQFWVIQFTDGTTRYIALEGLLDLANDAGRVLLRAGQTADFRSKTAPPEITLTNTDNIPDLEDEAGRRQTLEIYFKNNAGQMKTLRVDYQEK
ncbi:MAG: hypothetical protein Kow0042_31240 [Calditrichia bacterium]